MFFNHFFHIFAAFLPILHIFAAFLPAIVILIYVYKQDKFPEPKNIVFKTFIFGCATVLGIDLILPILDNFSESTFKGEAYYFFDSFIRAGFVEEIFKAMVIVFYCTRQASFDEPMDGIIYGVAASLGFAAYENVAYVQYFAEKTSLMDISLTRALSAVPMHGLCGVMMGFLITLSIFEKKHNYLNLVLAILIPVGMHGLYNFSLASSVVSYHIANVILFVFFLRAYYLFKDLKQKQRSTKIFHEKKYTITVTTFIQAASSVLVFYLILNYLILISF